MVKTKGLWRGKIKDWWKGTKKATASFVRWFKTEIAPELLEFLDANKDIAIKIVKQVAIEMASAPNGAKRGAAFSRLDNYFVKELPNFKAPDHWIGLLLEIAVAVLKASGKI